MFKRYTEASRKAVFFAREAALDAGIEAIDSESLRLGLIREPSNRANSLYYLNKLFPNDVPASSGLTHEKKPRDLQLTNDMKRILAYAAEESDRLDDYWIDTEHLVLGILRETGCAAQQRLMEKNLTLNEARRIAAENRISRQDLGP